MSSNMWHQVWFAPKKMDRLRSFFLTPVTTPLHSYQQLPARIPWQLGPECLQRARCHSTGIAAVGVELMVLGENTTTWRIIPFLYINWKIDGTVPTYWFTRTLYSSTFWYLHGVGIFTCIYIYIYLVDFTGMYISLPNLRVKSSSHQNFKIQKWSWFRLQKVSIKILDEKNASWKSISRVKPFPMPTKNPKK